MSTHRSSQQHLNLLVYLALHNQHKASTDTSIYNSAKEVSTIWKNLLDAYRKKVKSGSSEEPIDERALQWRYFDRMNFLKTFIGSKK